MKLRLTDIRSPKRPKRLRLVGIVSAVAILGLGATAGLSMRAGEKKHSEPQLNSTQAAANKAPRLAAQIVQKGSVNGQGGQIRPLTQEEAQRLAQGIKELVNRSQEGLKAETHPDGTVSMDLQGRFQNVALAKKNNEGSVTQACVDNLESAAAFFEIDPQLLTGQTKTGTPQTTKARVPVKPKS